MKTLFPIILLLYGLIQAIKIKGDLMVEAKLLIILKKYLNTFSDFAPRILRVYLWVRQKKRWACYFIFSPISRKNSLE